MDKLKNFDPNEVTGVAEPFFKTFKLSLPRGLEIAPTYWQAGAIVFLLFLLILMFGQLRHRFVGWQIKGIIPGILFGFFLALIIEGILIVGGGTVLTQTLGWKNAPKPISNALDIGRDEMEKVLGVDDNIEIDYENLSISEISSLRKIICTD